MTGVLFGRREQDDRAKSQIRAMQKILFTRRKSKVIHTKIHFSAANHKYLQVLHKVRTDAAALSLDSFYHALVLPVDTPEVALAVDGDSLPLEGDVDGAGPA